MFYATSPTPLTKKTMILSKYNYKSTYVYVNTNMKLIQDY